MSATMPTFVEVHVERHTPLCVEDCDVPLPVEVRAAIETGVMTANDVARLILSRFLGDEDENPDIDDDDRTLEVAVAIVLEQYGSAKVEP